MSTGIGFGRISLLTRLNSRVKLNFMQLMHEALVDTYSLLIGDELSPEQKMNIHNIKNADQRKLKYIIDGGDDMLKWYFLINPLKIPEFILTFFAYMLDRLCLVGLKEIPGSELRGQKMSWLRFLMRGLFRTVLALPIFFARCIGSPLNTVALPCITFFTRVLNYDPNHRDKKDLGFWASFKHVLIGEVIGWMWLIPYIELYIVLSSMIPALIAGVPLFSMGMVAAIFGGTGAALIATSLTLALLPIALPFVLSVAGNQPRPSDALYREVDLSHKGDDEDVVSSYAGLMQDIKRADPEAYKAFCLAKEGLDEAVDEALDNVPRRFERPRAKDQKFEKTVSSKYRELAIKYHSDHGAKLEGAQAILNREKELYPSFFDRFISDSNPNPNPSGSPGSKPSNGVGVD